MNAKIPTGITTEITTDTSIDKIKEVKGGEEFVKQLMMLKPDEVCALAKILGVRLLQDEVDPETKKAKTRDAYDIIDDCLVHFSQLGRTERRFLLKYLKKKK